MPITSAAAPMPILPNVTPDGWAASIKARPSNVTAAEWNAFALVAAEMGAKRAVSSARLKAAISTGQKGSAPSEMIEQMKDALLNSLQLEATDTGKAQIAAQKPLTFARAGGAAAPAAAAATAAAVTPAVAKAKAAAGAPGGEDAAYAKIVKDVQAGKGKTYTYGKLNFAFEIARKKGDVPTQSAIAKDMHEIRPLVPGPGRYGITDKEYTNYAMVMKALTDGDDAPAAAMAMAAKTADKIGHTEVATMLRDKLPAAPATAKAPVVAAKAAAPTPSKKVPVAAAATVATAATAAAVVATKGPEGDFRGVPAAIWKKLPPPPSQSISMADWQTYAVVHYFLGTKNAMPTPDELRTASAVAAKVGKPARAKIYGALAPGQTIATMVDARKTALGTSPPSKYAAEIIGNSIIAQAAHSDDPATLKLAAQIAKEQGHSKTYTALLARIPAAPGAAVAAKPAAAKPAAAVAQVYDSETPGKKVPTGKITTSKTGKPDGVSDRDWAFFTVTIKKVNSKQAVPVEELDHAKRIADSIHYDQTSVQLARAAADARHGQAVAAKTPAAAPTARGGMPMAAKVAVPVAAAAAVTTAAVVATRSSAPAPTRAAAPVAARAPEMRPPPPIAPTSPAMVPPETVAEVPVTPPKAAVEASAKATGVTPAAVAEKVLAAKNDEGNARAEVAQGADLNRRLSSADKPTAANAREELKELHAQKAGGDSDATEKLVALGAAAAAATAAAAAMTAAAKVAHEKGQAAPAVAAPTSAEVVVAAKGGGKERVEAPQASIAGPPSEGAGVGTVVAGLGLLGLGIVVLSGKKKKTR